MTIRRTRRRGKTSITCCASRINPKLFRADVLRHNKDLPQAEQTLRSLLNDDPQNAAARENLYYVLREQNKS
ncbi:hypothetical protein CQA67_32895, partial [Klebsiella pneumoniae]